MSADGPVAASRRSGVGDEKRRSPRTVTVTTLTGARLVLDANAVQSITRRPLLFEEFDVRNRQTPQEMEPLRSLAEWCRSKGLRTQREDVLRRILSIDPDDAAAHQGLGEARYDGQWKTHEEEMRSRGFVKFEGRYVTPQEITIRKNLQSRRKLEHDWTEKIRGWTQAMFSDDAEKRRRGRAQLMKVTDPKAIPALNRVVRASESEDMRALYVHILSRIPGPEPVSLLVQQSLFDSSQAVRVAAQELITPQRRDQACPIYAHELKNSENDVVRRAAMMLEKIGDDRFVPQLIDALVTTHQVATQVLDNSNTYSFGRNGTFGNPDSIALPPDVAGKLAAGAYPNGIIVMPTPDQMARVRTVMVPREFKNSEALSALETLTKQSFGYDKDEWKRWWAMRTTTGVVRSSRSQTPAAQ